MSAATPLNPRSLTFPPLQHRSPIFFFFSLGRCITKEQLYFLIPTNTHSQHLSTICFFFFSLGPYKNYLLCGLKSRTMKGFLLKYISILCSTAPCSHLLSQCQGFMLTCFIVLHPQAHENKIITPIHLHLALL